MVVGDAPDPVGLTEQSTSELELALKPDSNGDRKISSLTLSFYGHRTSKVNAL